MRERPKWIQTARYTFLQSATVTQGHTEWTPIQVCLNEACNAYDELLKEIEALERECDGWKKQYHHLQITL